MAYLPDFHICLINPPGYIHADALLDPAQYFYWQFRRLGQRVSLARNLLRHDAINFVFGAHLGFDTKLLQIYSCIIVNLEQIGQRGAPLPGEYLSLLKQAVVIDYDANNPAAYSAQPDDIPIISFGHAEWLKPTPSQALPLAKRPLDLIFIGSMNERRQKLIRRIESTGRRVSALAFPVYGNTRNSIILQAKALLNLHFYETARFEQVRAFVGLSLATPVLSERHANTSAGLAFDTCVTWFNNDQLEGLFHQDFGSQTFYEVAQQQLTLFETVDPVAEYADLVAFASGVWQAHQSVLSLVDDDNYIGPRMPLPSCPEVSARALIPGIPLSPREQDSSGSAIITQDAGHPAPIFQTLPDVCHEVDQLIDAKRFDLAMLMILLRVNNHFYQPGIAEHALYYPDLDRKLLALAAIMRDESTSSKSCDAVSERRQLRKTLLIASEIYEIGGHTRVLEELSNNRSSVTLVITNPWGNFDQPSLEKTAWIHQRFPAADIIILKGDSLWEKAKELHTLCQTARPEQIWYLQHHQDPIPFVGTLYAPACARIYVHHGDHNPSLGCTLAGIHHVDLTESLMKTCRQHLRREVSWLPLYVKDEGARKVQPISKKYPFSVVTAGRESKFILTGPVALQTVVRSVLTSIAGRFHHIGPLNDQAIRIIRDHLQSFGIDPARFVCHGEVSSLWQTLHSLDAHVYVGSAPVSGARGALEAQGCGYPVLPFCGFEHGSMLADYSSYANLSLAWKDPESLARILTDIPHRYEALCTEARHFYEQRFSRDIFCQKLDDIVHQASGMHNHITRPPEICTPA